MRHLSLVLSVALVFMLGLPAAAQTNNDGTTDTTATVTQTVEHQDRGFPWGLLGLLGLLGLMKRPRQVVETHVETARVDVPRVDTPPRVEPQPPRVDPTRRP